VQTRARGGNLLLNIGPSPDGDWDDTAYARLKEIGAWMTINGEGIYGTHPVQPFSSGTPGSPGAICLTQSKDSLNIYVFYLGDGNKDITLPAELTIDRFAPPTGTKVMILGVKVKKLKWREAGKKMIIEIPPSLQNKVVGQHAVTFKID
jgi:alpha-L-fucosidase